MTADRKSAAAFHPHDGPVGEVPPELLTHAAIGRAADGIRGTNSAVQIGGVRIEECDTYGATATTRRADAAEADRDIWRGSVIASANRVNEVLAENLDLRANLAERVRRHTADGHWYDAQLAAVTSDRDAERARADAAEAWKANAEITLREDKRVMQRDWERLRAVEALWDREINKGLPFLADSSVVPELRTALSADAAPQAAGDPDARCARCTHTLFDHHEDGMDEAPTPCAVSVGPYACPCRQFRGQEQP